MMAVVQTTAYGSSFFCAAVAETDLVGDAETDAETDSAETTACGLSFFSVAAVDVVATHFRAMVAAVQTTADAAKSLNTKEVYIW